MDCCKRTERKCCKEEKWKKILKEGGFSTKEEWYKHLSLTKRIRKVYKKRKDMKIKT
tara:strand:- start:69 stop:239 length:171 start_codon:yes stop_codon:yes gene_type:complete